MKFIFGFLFAFQIFISNAQNLPSLEIPAPSAQMPSWANKLYEAPLNLYEVEAAYKEYYATHEFVKDNYTRYFKRLIMLNREHITETGEIKKLSSVPDNEIKNSIEGQFHNPPGSIWTPYEMHTYWLHNDFASQPMCPWQSNIYSMDASPSNNSVLYVGTETGGYFKTTDMGLNWTQIAMINDMGSSGAIAVNPVNQNIVLNAAGNSLWRSVDGGATWTAQLTVSNLYGNAIEYHPSNDLIAVAATELGIYRSVNGGLTWNNVLGNTCSDVVFNPTNPTEVYALRKNTGTNFYEFYKSFDSGATWSLSSTGWPAGLTEGQGRIGVSPASSTMVYCVLLTNAGPYVMKSSNSGATWSTAATGSTVALEMNNGQGYYDLDIVVSSTNANHVIVATTTAYKSTDGGINYTAVGGYTGPFPIHPDIQEMISYNGHTWIATDGGLTYSTDFFSNTANASARVRGLNSADFWGFDIGWQNDIMVGGRYHNGNTAITDNYGGKFLRMGGAEAATGYVNPVDGRTYFSDLGGRILPDQFTDDASSFPVGLWPNESYFTLHSSEMAWHPQCYNTVFIGNGPGIYKSTNGGMSYTLLFTSPDAGAEMQAIEISRSNPDIIYVVQRSNTLYDGKIWKTTNGGLNWSALPNIPGTSGSERRIMQISVSGTNANDIWVALHAGNSLHKVYKSVNGGSSWSNLTTGVISAVTITDMVHQLGTNGGVYIGCYDGKVYYRNAAMAEWVLYNSGLPAALNTLYLKPYYQEGKLRNGCNMGIWEIDLYESSAPIAQPTVDKQLSECVRDTFYFGDYSVLNLATASWTWDFPGASFVSDVNSRNPKVVYPSEGMYDVTLTVTDVNGTSSKTITSMVNINGNYCDVETVPGNSFNVVNAGEYLSAPALNITSNTITLSAWIKPTGTQMSYAGVIFSGSDGACGLNFRNTNQLGYHWQDNAGTYNWGGGPTVVSNQWSHVALVITPTNATVYLNGVAYIRTASHAAANLDEPFLIGSDRGNSSRNFIGEMEEICIYNRALSQNEIRELMHLTRNNPSGFPVNDPLLEQYYQMNEPSGNIAYDRAGLLHASFVGSGNMSRLISSAPVAGGVSQRMSIISNGIKNFVLPGVSMQFGAGTLPNGDVVVSRLDHQPDVLPSCPNYDAGNHYYIVSNYGANQIFTSLNQLTISGIPVYDPANVPASTYSLQRRNFFASGTPWTAVNNATIANEGLTGSLQFGSGLTNFGQLFIQNGLVNQNINGNSPVCEGVESFYSIAEVSGMNYEWSSAMGSTMNNENTSTVSVVFNLDDTIECVFSKNGCEGLASFVVDVNPSGCTDPSAFNYDPSAICDDAGCIYESCPGDFDNNGVVNTSDLLLFMGGFGCTSGCLFDLTGDDQVNTSDILIMLGYLGIVCP